jgi:transposase-like protein
MASARSLSQFQEAFSDEASCAAFMFKRRWPDGFVCPACGKRRVAALKSRPRLHECLDCGRQTSVTAGTVMHRSRLPLTTWFWAAHLMTTHSNGMSALQLQDQLGVTYKTAWLLTQKLRRSNPETPAKSSSSGLSKSSSATQIKPNRDASTPNISTRVPAAFASP